MNRCVLNLSSRKSRFSRFISRRNEFPPALRLSWNSGIITYDGSTWQPEAEWLFSERSVSSSVSRTKWPGQTLACVGCDKAPAGRRSVGEWWRLECDIRDLVTTKTSEGHSSAFARIVIRSSKCYLGACSSGKTISRTNSRSRAPRRWLCCGTTENVTIS